MDELLETLTARGMVHDSTPELAARLKQGPISGYVGFDPTADSLHVGNLVPVMALAWLQRLGGRPIVLVGGGTGMVGDPSGKRSERPMLGAEQVASNARSIQGQLSRFLEFGKTATSAELCDNAEWLGRVGLLEFLRDAGKHFTISHMLQKESVKSRMETGISFTEFAYMLVQAYDFAHLAQQLDCELQMGGSDQWGNITAGIHLAAARDNRKLHGLTLPLLTTSSGAKFGKSEQGNVWLDPAKTSPWHFHQFWLNVEDADVERLLKFFTFMPLDEIDHLIMEHQRNPGHRRAQRQLADDVTARIHGATMVQRVNAVAAILFGGAALQSADAETMAMVAEAVPTVRISRDILVNGLSMVDALILAKLAESKGDARRGLSGGGYSLNGQTSSEETRVTEADLLAGDIVLLRKGKRSWAGILPHDQ